MVGEVGVCIDAKESPVSIIKLIGQSKALKATSASDSSGMMDGIVEGSKD